LAKAALVGNYALSDLWIKRRMLVEMSAEQEQAKERTEETQEEKPTEAEEPIDIGKPEFSHLVETFAVQALISLGIVMNPITKKYERDLVLAKYEIGILEVLEQKTKGNLTPDEEKLLEELLHNVRMAYVDVSREKKT
jgi:hypothetical protein